MSVNTNQPLRALVVSGEGINCERESQEACMAAGFEVEIRHIRDLVAEQMGMDELSRRYGLLLLPGGFSYGDHLASGKVLALQIQYRLKWNLAQFADRGGLVLGICNGFQALIRLGQFGRDLSITRNIHGKFINTWVRVTPQGSRCVFLRGLGTMELPVRHGEGRIVVEQGHRNEILSKFDRSGMSCLKYEKDVNGSEQQLAGLCDPSGRIFGLMPHPEGFLRWSAHPEWTLNPGRAGAPGLGLSIFENAARELRAAF